MREGGEVGTVMDEWWESANLSKAGWDAMCGIVGYAGDPKKTLDILLSGLKMLEYRGYDSSGVAVLSEDVLSVVKSEGKLKNLIKKLDGSPLQGNVGIGHTRWATHGASTENNAHPHVSGSTVVVHNGIIENFMELREYLRGRGYEFYSETDTEVIAHLIEDSLEGGLGFEDAVRDAFSRIQGSYAVVAMTSREPDKIIGVRKFSPLVLGVGEGEYFFASDTPALLPYTRDVLFLEDGEMAVVDGGVLKLTDLSGNDVKRDSVRLVWDQVQVEKEGFKHFMLKEIHEQPRAVLDTIRGRFDIETGRVGFEGIDSGVLGGMKRILILACGTSYHASLVGKYMIESLARLPVEVDLASEFRYRGPMVDSDTLVIAVSQSGETADTSEALLLAKTLGARTLAVTNVATSKIAREADFTVFTNAGLEIGVASTKAFTAQLSVLYLIALSIAAQRNTIDKKSSLALVNDLVTLPKLIELTLKEDALIKRAAKEFYKYDHFLYLGRGINFPIALEGALKLKEISYIHAEGYAAGEMKHGPIALVDENMPVVVVAPDDGITHSKVLGNIQEISARGGMIILVASNSTYEALAEHVHTFIPIPQTSYVMTPIVAVVPLQLLAYHIAAFKGTDIDQPRNLAKVVTVE